METETLQNSRRSPFRWLIPVMVVAVLVVGTMVFVLALLGPTVGNIFSNVSRGLSRDGGSGGGSYSGPSVASSGPGHPIARNTPVPAAPPVNLQPLNPMKAGEINDNAEWDSYTDYRRLYLSRYPASTIIDFDVTGRRIIKVVDASGQPIMGAHVEIFVDTTRISDTLTYATGMTLFFPNADERSKRRDQFSVVVTVGQHQISQTIDLRSLGDTFEARMPIVMTENGNNRYFVTVTPAVIPTSTFVPNAEG